MSKFALNQEQQEIIQETEGIKLVVSGPGTGKTTTVTHFLAKILATKKALPEEVLAVTFTVKAAREMRERVRNLTGTRPHVATIHAFARQILCQFPPPGYTPEFTIISEKQEWRLIKRILAARKLDMHPQLVKEKLTLARNTRESSRLDKDMDTYYRAYMQELRRNNAMDFDALLTWGIWTFENNPAALRHYRNQYKYLLVDEFQDTSQLQYALLKPLVTANFLCVGDYDQSIYGFRGADVKLILNLGKDFPNLETYYLKENYRCSKEIVRAANSLIANNQKRQPKPHFTNQPEGVPIIRESCVDSHREAEYVATEIEKAHKQGAEWKDFAVLYRINNFSIPFTKALTAKKIPFQAIGDSDYFDLPEIKNILCFLQLVAEPDNTLARADALSALNNLRHSNPAEMLSVLLTELAKLQDLEAMYKLILAKTGMERELQRNTSQAGLRSQDNVSSLLPVLQDYQKKGLHDFLEFSQEARSSDEEDAVNLLTIHKAKGLEFNTVFVVGLDDNTMPYFHNQGLESLEEERRMLYVALTRAKEKLYLTYPRQRQVQNKKRRCYPSRFLKELKLEEDTKSKPIVTGNIAALSSQRDYRAEAEASRKENPQGPWKDSTDNRWGICKHCKKFTRDWWTLDGTTNICECNDCKYKGR